MRCKTPEIKIQFPTTAGTVTGSGFIIRAAGKTIFVNGSHLADAKDQCNSNSGTSAVSASAIDIVLLTQPEPENIDYLPQLVHEGFCGQIRGTYTTLKIIKLILEQHLREEDKTSGDCYTYDDIKKTILLFHPQPAGALQEIETTIYCRFCYSGNVTGAAFVELTIGCRTLIFSGRPDREQHPLMRPLEDPATADILFIADQDELPGWLSALKRRPFEIFIMNNTPATAQVLKNKIKELYDWDAAIPRLNQVIVFPVE